MDKKLRILFVDDEPQVLQGIRRMLHRMRDEWESTFVDSGAEALAKLAAQPFEVVVSDMRMPQMNGAELLAAVKRDHPETIRLILSGYSDPAMVLKTVGVAHQYLTKPCNPDELRSTIRRAQSLNELHHSSEFRRYVGSIASLPPMPDLYLEISRELESDDPDLDKLIARAKTDPGLTMRVLQLVNSGFFGLPQRVVEVGEAIHILGARVLKSLVLLGGLTRDFESPATQSFVTATAEHSLAVAQLATALAPVLGLSREDIAEAYTAGVLHDVGKMIFAADLGQRYLKLIALAEEKAVSVSALERRVLKADHGQLGSYLLRLWGLPDSLAHCVAYHASPRRAETAGVSLLTAVHLADRMLAVSRPQPTFTMDDFDRVYLEALDLQGELPRWQVVFDHHAANASLAV